MKINLKKVLIIYSLLYLSLLAGFYFNEDLGSGYIMDYSFDKYIADLFDKNFSETFLNYDELERKNAHSPVFIIFFFILQKISFSETFARFINLHLSLLIPYFFYLSLKLKYQFKFNDIKILLPTVIFFSPYFRSASNWIGSENISLIFLSICIYYFLKYENSKKKEFWYIFLTTIFIALAAYIRPIYSLFSIYFFVRFYLDLKLSTKLLYYILTNILLSLPAIYYVFILKVNFFIIHLGHVINLSRFVNQFSIIISIIFFYSIPFLLPNIKNQFKLSFIKIENIILSIIFLYFLIFYFNYDSWFDYITYGGGIFFKISLLIFNNNYLFYFFSLISLNVLFVMFFIKARNKDKFVDLILLLILIFLELDPFIYHETYDPLLYFIFFLLIKNKIYLNFTKKLTNKKFILLILFSISFYVLSIFKTIYDPIKIPMYQSSNVNLFYNANITSSNN